MNGYRVVSYMKCIPPGNKKAQKPLIIRNFIEGVNRHGKQFVQSKFGMENILSKAKTSWKTVCPKQISDGNQFVQSKGTRN